MSKFGSLAANDKPFRVELLAPETSQVIRDKDGNPSYVEVRAADGAVGRKYDKEERAAQLERARRGQPDTSSDPLDRNIAKCAALTTGWYLIDPETGEEIAVPCTPESAKEFYSLPATNWFLQVWIKANDNGNFTQRSAKNSMPTQSGASEEAAS